MRSTATDPAVTFIIPSHNRLDLLMECIDSLREQTSSAWQALVVDDGSEDGTYEAMKDIHPAISVIRQANEERGAARNNGARRAMTPFLSFLDSDDVVEPWHVSQFVAALSNEPVYVASTPALLWDPRLNRTHPVRPLDSELRRAALLGTALPLPGLFISIDAFQRIGGFPEDRSLAGSEDFVFIARLVARFDVLRLQHPSVRIRQHVDRSMYDLSIIHSRRAALRHLLTEGVSGSPPDAQSEKLLRAGTHRFCAAHLYLAGRMQDARAELAQMRRILGIREWFYLGSRLWIQTWLGRRGSRLLRRLKLRKRI